jgi:hypothetical protein
VISALTGETVAKVEDYLVDVMGVDLDGSGASAADLMWAFCYFGREMTYVASFDAPCPGPPLTDWLDGLPIGWRRRRPLVVAVEAPMRLGHWVAVWVRASATASAGAAGSRPAHPGSAGGSCPCVDDLAATEDGVAGRDGVRAISTP